MDFGLVYFKILTGNPWVLPWFLPSNTGLKPVAFPGEAADQFLQADAGPTAEAQVIIQGDDEEWSLGPPRLRLGDVKTAPFRIPGLINVDSLLWKDPPCYSWENPRTKSPFSIAMLVITRG